MNKVFVLNAGEDWIVDRFVKEWIQDNGDITTLDPNRADVIWILASWCWRHLRKDTLSKKKVIVTVHHIVPEKFDIHKRLEFEERDSLVSAYHVYNNSTLDFIKPLTKKPIHLLPYWANQKIWQQVPVNKLDLRRKYSLPDNSYLVGSFQRDTEGSDLITPKLEKGPDLFVDFLEKIRKEGGEKSQRLHVLLCGWRRQYVISRLNNLNINYTYFEKPDQEVLNELYQTLDLYPMTSRYEGGPQSLIECGLLNVPVVSRDVGIASQVLPAQSINDDVYFASPAVPIISSQLMLPEGYQVYRNLIERI